MYMKSLFRYSEFSKDSCELTRVGCLDVTSMNTMKNTNPERDCICLTSVNTTKTMYQITPIINAGYTNLKNNKTMFPGKRYESLETPYDTSFKLQVNQ